MRYSILIFFALILTFHPARGQDTVIVQTFTRDSSGRTGMFDFPDEDPASWEKIIMLYNMRCHDAAIGNGNVGCREWDYSCNTFITDPSMQDSTRQTSPSHRISNFDNEPGNVYRYKNSPVYSYLELIQHQTDFTLSGNATRAQVGDKTLDTPLTGAGNTGKSQFLFKASELIAAGLSAGKIAGIAADISSPANPVHHLRIRIKATQQQALSALSPQTDGFTEVYFKNTDFPNTGDQFFKFYEDYSWDGSSNLLVEFTFTGTNTAQVTVKGHETLSATSLVSTQTDNALQLKNTGVIDLTEDSYERISNEITIAFWSYGDEDILPVSTSIIEAVDAQDERQINIHHPWENENIYWDCGNDGTGFDRIQRKANPADYKGRWTHWAFTKNATTGEMKIYLDGVLWHSGTGFTKPINIDRIQLGKSINSNWYYYGRVDELSVWNSALAESTIRDWMFQKIDTTHPDYNQLVAYYPMDENSGTFIENTISQHRAPIYGTVRRTYRRGTDLFKNFEAAAVRPTLTFVQGNYSVIDNDIPVRDSFQNAPDMMQRYEVIGTDLSIIDTQFVWDVDRSFVYSENGNIIDFGDPAPDASVTISELEYFDKKEAKFEILSLVTPYGNGLDLGQDGKTFKIDVSDYAPILKGTKRMSIELGGQNQEELDIKFLFIRGTPPRIVKSIQNIWPFRRGYFNQIQDDRFFEPRAVSIAGDGAAFKIRASITGHQQNGEFQIRNHYFNIDGGAKEFNFDVVKECSDIPIYPQGGTWLFDRAGWCPGDPTAVHEFDISHLVTPGGSSEIDYGVNGPTMQEANYLVSAQLVTYGAPEFNLDAEVVEIIRPTQQLEYARFNPACNTPAIKIRNTGATPLTSLDIEYGEKQGVRLSYTWSGQLEFMETAQVDLPLNFLSFWNEGTAEDGVFEVHISRPNGGTDEYTANNSAVAKFTRPAVFEFPLELELRTNSRGGENAYTIKDMEGNIILERDGLDDNTTYSDVLNLGRGCYTFELTDSGDDGLYYWYWEQVGPARGRGNVRFLRITPQGIKLTAKRFEPEFGRFLRFDFVVPESTGTAAPGELQRLSVFPNPAHDYTTIELAGFEREEFTFELSQPDGRIVKTIPLTIAGTDFNYQLNLRDLPKGMYFLKIRNDKQVWIKPVIKQ